MKIHQKVDFFVLIFMHNLSMLLSLLFSENSVFLLFFYIFFRLPIDIFFFVRYYNINKRKGGRTTNQLDLYLKFKERGTVQCRGQFKLKRV